MLNCIIYQIKCLETGEVYIGSTIQTINNRMKEHKKKRNQCISKKIIDRGNYKVSVLLHITCKDTKERHRIEGNFIQAEPNAINMSVPGRTRIQYRLDNRERLNEIAKKYFQDNKERIAVYRKKYTQERKEFLSLYHKQNYRKKKEKKSKYNQQYQINNKERLKHKRIWINTWGGDPQSHNNLLKIDVFNL